MSVHDRIVTPGTDPDRFTEDEAAAFYRGVCAQDDVPGRAAGRRREGRLVMTREWLLPTGPPSRRSEIYVCDRCGHRHWYARQPQWCSQPGCSGTMTRSESDS